MKIKNPIYEKLRDEQINLLFDLQTTNDEDKKVEIRAKISEKVTQMLSIINDEYDGQTREG
jgi:hypothetical protein